MKKTMKLAVVAITAGLVAYSSQATLVNYTWVADSTDNPNISTGSFTYDTVSGQVSSFSWTDGSGTVDAFFNQFNVTLLTGNNLQLRGYGEASSSLSTSDLVQWASFNSSGDAENIAYDFSNQTAYWGDWVAGSTTTTSAVPEPGTVLTGALLLLPLGAGALRRLRKA